MSFESLQDGKWHQFMAGQVWNRETNVTQEFDDFLLAISTLVCSSVQHGINVLSAESSW